MLWGRFPSSFPAKGLDDWSTRMSANPIGGLVQQEEPRCSGRVPRPTFWRAATCLRSGCHRQAITALRSRCRGPLTGGARSGSRGREDLSEKHLRMQLRLVRGRGSDLESMCSSPHRKICSPRLRWCRSRSHWGHRSLDLAKHDRPWRAYRCTAGNSPRRIGSGKQRIAFS